MILSKNKSEQWIYFQFQQMVYCEQMINKNYPKYTWTILPFSNCGSVFTRTDIDNELWQKLEQSRKSPIDIGRTASSMAILGVKFSSWE